MTLLRAAPDLLASVITSIPARIVKRLDAKRDIARGWTWTVTPEGGTVVTEGGETVTVRATESRVVEASQITCSCLLSPRCFHVLAVIAALDVDDGSSQETAAPEGVPATKEESRAVTLDAKARAAASRARTVAADVVATGARGVGAVLEAELLRVVHLARVEGLYRLAAATVRVVKDIRDLREDADDFSTGSLVDDLAEMIATAVRLERDEVPFDAIGVARRAYDRIGHLRLVGIACEPVVARGGYGGIVTHLIDETGKTWSIGDVMPGGEARARGAYDAAIAMGDTTITHRALSRGGLFVQDATASADRRLGAGKDVKAVRSASEEAWRSAAVRARFDEPLASQLARAYGALTLPVDQRPRGDALVFVRGHVIGHDDTALQLAADPPLGGPIRLVSPASHGTLSTFENLRHLSDHPGLALELIGSLVPAAGRTLSLIAFGPWEQEGQTVRLTPPPEWHGVVNAGYDVVQRSHFSGSSASPRLEGGPRAFDPLIALRRWIERIALHGARGLPAEAMNAIEIERAELARMMMTGAADLLGVLATAAQARRHALRDAWLASAAYSSAATIALWRAAWT